MVEDVGKSFTTLIVFVSSSLKFDRIDNAKTRKQQKQTLSLRMELLRNLRTEKFFLILFTQETKFTKAIVPMFF